jgi:hypothetical protein
MFPKVSGSEGSKGFPATRCFANPPLEKVEPNKLYKFEIFGSTFSKGGFTRGLHAFNAPCCQHKVYRLHSCETYRLAS